MNKRYYISLVVLVGGILLLGWGYFFALRMIWEKAGNIVMYKNDVLLAEQKKQHAELMLSSLEGVQADISNLQNFFVKKQGEVEFIEFLEQNAKAQKLEVKIETASLESSKEMQEKGVEYLRIRFVVVGTWADVWNFSRTLELFPYSIHINSLAFIREDTNTPPKNKPVIWKGVYVIKVLKKK